MAIGGYVTVDDHRKQARKLYNEARKLRAKGSNDIEHVQEVERLELLAESHDCVAQSLIKRQKKRGNMENGKA